MTDEMKSSEKCQVQSASVQPYQVAQATVPSGALGIMTKLTMNDLNKANQQTKALIQEVQMLRNERDRLLHMILSPESLAGNDTKFKYYTGLLSYMMLKTIFDFVSPFFQTYSRTALPLFSQFLIVLLRLRLNMDIEQLSYHFEIHASNILRSISKLFNVLDERLGALIKWPEHEELIKTMPNDFEAFAKCTVIVGCFEVFMERPSALNSEHKHGQTTSTTSGKHLFHFSSVGWLSIRCASNSRVWFS